MDLQVSIVFGGDWFISSPTYWNGNNECIIIAFRFSYYFNCSSHLDDQRHPPIRRKSSECVYNLRARKWSLLSTSVSEVFQFELKNCGFHFSFPFWIVQQHSCFLTFWPACLWHSQHQVECTLSGMYVANIYTLPPNTFDSTPISHSLLVESQISLCARAIAFFLHLCKGARRRTDACFIHGLLSTRLACFLHSPQTQLC